MATAVKKCRVCGKEYTACHTLARNTGVFRWQEVACSPECGSIYLDRIRASRASTQPKVENIVVDAEITNSPTQLNDIDIEIDDIDESEDDEDADDYVDDDIEDIIF